MFECDFCGKSLVTQYVLREHKKNIHSTETFPCESCEKTFKSVRNRDLHFQRMHGENKDIKRYKCETCNKAFKYYSVLYAHINNIHGERKWSCYFCGRKFASKGNLKAHQEGVHSSETCQLTDHVSTHQLDSGLTQYNAIAVGWIHL